MTSFIFLFRMDITTPEAQPDEATMQEYMQSWNLWVNGLQANGHLLGGNHFTPSGAVLTKGAAASTGPYVSDTQSVAGYLIVGAADMKEALSLAEACPVLQGDNTSVEVRQIMDMG